MDAREIFFKCRSSLVRIKTVNLEQFRRPVFKKPGRIQCPTPHVSKSLPFGQIELPSLLGTLTGDEMEPEQRFSEYVRLLWAFLLKI